MTADDEDRVACGKALASLRRKAKLTQLVVAPKVGVRNSYVSQIETGVRSLSYGTLLALLRVYGVTLRDYVDELERWTGDAK